jgi:hypothetical protein
LLRGSLSNFFEKIIWFLYGYIPLNKRKHVTKKLWSSIPFGIVFPKHAFEWTLVFLEENALENFVMRNVQVYFFKGCSAEYWTGFIENSLAKWIA